MTNLIEDYWKNYQEQSNLDKDVRFADVFYFGSSELSARHLLDLVLQGQKTATCSSKNEFTLKNLDLPKIGDYCIITDWNHVPKCIVKTTNILFTTFEEMTFDVCKREGEDDSLESWQENHISFFTTQGKELGYHFSWNMDIIFEDFVVVYQ